MEKIKAFCATERGQSHIDKGKVCQDASGFKEYPEEGIYISVVSDGHGSESYFRSDKGSEFAVSITLEAIYVFVKNTDKALLAVPYQAIPALSTEVKESVNRKETEQDRSFRQLFSYIISRWNDRIEEDWKKNPPTEEEMKNVPDKAKNAFLVDQNLEKAYGCTLMAFVRTPDYWFAFHIGDGKCVAFYENGEWDEPIPWDEQCFLNYTTSMCDKRALDNFRYCYGKDHLPLAVFLGSDGMDDSFGAIENLANFYGLVLKLFVKEGYDKSMLEIPPYLRKLTAQGSRDDMSIAGVLDLEGIKKMIPLFIDKQKKQLQQRLKDVELKKKQSEELLQEKKKELEESCSEEDVLRIEMQQEEDKMQQETAKQNTLFGRKKRIFDSIEKRLSSCRDIINNSVLARKGLEKKLKEKEAQGQKLNAEIKYAESDINRAAQEQTTVFENLEKLEEEYKMYSEIAGQE